MKSRWFRVSPWLAVLAIIALATLLYGRALSFAYVWDDTLLFLDKTALLNEPLSWSLLADPVLPGTSYMRPLVFLTLFVEFKLFGQSPLVSHAVNLALFMCNGLLLYAVCRRISLLTDRGYASSRALLAAVFYVIHPALVESTAWVSGRFDVMVTLFMLLAVLVYLAPAVRTWLRILWVSLLMLAALLSKELGVVLPGVLLCIWVACNADPDESPLQTIKRALKSNTWLLLALLATFAVYMGLRIQSVGGVYHAALTPDYLRSALFESLLPLEALKLYAMGSVLPFLVVDPLHPGSELNPHGFLSLLTSALTLGALLLLLAWAWFKRTTAAWLTLSGLLCLLPVLHLLPMTIGGNIGHERFMTAALAFLSMAVVQINYRALFDRWGILGPVGRRALVLTGVGWSALSVLTVHSVLPIWSSDLQLWNWAYRAHPDFEYARYNYLYGAMRAGRLDLLEKEVKRLQQAEGGLGVGEQIIYGNMLIRTGDSEGLKYLQGVMYALPKFHEQVDGREFVDRFKLTHLQMGEVYADYANGLLMFEGDPAEALKYNEIAEWYFQESERIPVLYQRVAIFYTLGRFSEADDLYRRLELLAFHRKEYMKIAVVNLLTKYCALKKAEGAASCQEIERSGLVASLLQKVAEREN